MQLNETILTKLILEETQREKLPDGVLCRVKYNVNNIGKRNANKRVYEKAVWDKVLSNDDLKQKLEGRALFGHAEHPEQTQSNLEKTSHVIFEMWIDEKEGKVYQKMDVLDTPTGRIVDTLIRAGCQVGISTRAEGDLEEAEDDEGTYQRVIPESYRYVTTDFTADPSTFGVVPQDIKRNIVSAVGKELSNEKADKSEKEFARLLLESMRCGKKDSCQNCGCCRVLEKCTNKTNILPKTSKENKESKKYIAEGCWSYPYTEDKAKKLFALFEKPLVAKEAKDVLYDLVGDDTLFDALDKAEEKSSSDVRPEIKIHIKNMLEMYHKQPGDFKYGFEPKALEILHLIVDKGVSEVNKKDEKKVKDLITEGTVKVGTKVKYGDQDAEIKEIRENVVALSVGIGLGTPTSVQLQGDASISVSPDGIITIFPVEALNKLAQKPLKVEEPSLEKEPEDWTSDRIKAQLTADQTGEKPEAYKEVEELPESKVNEDEEDEIQVGDTIQVMDKDENVYIVPKAIVYQVDEALGSDGEMHTTIEVTGSDDEDEQEWYSEEEYSIIILKSASESKVDETIRKKKDGWHVYSKKGKHLGGPYSTKKKAEDRLDQVEKFKHMKEEYLRKIENRSKLSEQVGDADANLVRDIIGEDIPEDKVLDAYNSMKETILARYMHPEYYKEEYEEYTEEEIEDAILGRYLSPEYFDKDEIDGIREEIGLPPLEESETNIGNTKLLEEFYNFMDEKEFPDWDEGVKLFAEHKKVDVNKLTEQFVELFPEGDIISENWKDLPKGWTRKSLKSFARSLLGKVGKSGKGFVTACIKKMEGKVGNPAAFCAGLKDEVMRTTKWRGKKESIDEKTTIYDFRDVVENFIDKWLEDHPDSEIPLSVLTKEFEIAAKEQLLSEGKEKEAKESKVVEAMSVKQAQELLGDRATWELRAMKKALETLSILNTPEDKERLEAVKVLLKTRKECREDEEIREAYKYIATGNIPTGMGKREPVQVEFTSNYDIDKEKEIVMDRALRELRRKGASDTIYDMDVRKVEESISSISKEITNLKVQEASIRAERDKAIELLEELNKGSKSLESKMLVSRFKKIIESRSSEVSALIVKLEEKAKIVSELKKDKTKLKEELDKVKINLVTDIRKLEEKAKDAGEFHKKLLQAEDKMKELGKELDLAKKECERIKSELDKLSKKHSESIEQLKSEFSTKITEEVEKTKKEVTSEFVKRFVALRLAESELKVDANSRALLENCESLEDVDNIFEEILDASRRNALHSNLIESIKIDKPIDPEQQQAERMVNIVVQGFGYNN